MQNEQLFHLITKKLSNDISKKEALELNQLLELGANQAIYNDLKLKWEASGKLTIKYMPDTEKSWHSFKEKTNKGSAKQIKLIPILYRVAAVAVLAFGLGYFYFQESPLLITEHSTSQGETIEITLPDNSTIWLNESSYLSYNENFNKENRRVTLKGEAFFEVEKNPNKAFIIKASNALTRVIGTSFNISAYEHEPMVSIHVSTGKVAFSEASGHNIVQLVKGESAQLDISTLAINKTAFTNPNHAAWRTKKLIFKDADLVSVVHDLNEYYDVKIQFESDAIGNCKLTSSFSNSTIEEVLEVLNITLDISSTTTNKGYLLTGKGCSD